MYCPQCGQRQATNEARFCSGCGFSLNVVGELLANGGRLPWRPPAPGGGQLSPRQKGIRQGAFLMLSTVVVLPVVIFLGVALLHLPGVLIPLAAVSCVMGGLLRIIYAALFESNETAPTAGAAPHYAPPVMPPNYLGTPPPGAALPPPQSAPVSAYRRPQRFDTGELPAPPTASVTDHTTRLLDKQPDDTPKQ